MWVEEPAQWAVSPNIRKNKKLFLAAVSHLSIDSVSLPSRYLDILIRTIYYLSTPISRTSGRAPAGWVLRTVLWGRQWLVKVSDGTFGLRASSQSNVGHLQLGGNLCCPFNILNTKPGSSINQKYLHLDEWGVQVVRCNVWAVSELNLIPKMKWATECNSNKSLDLKWNFSLNGKVKI